MSRQASSRFPAGPHRDRADRAAVHCPGQPVDMVGVQVGQDQQRRSCRCRADRGRRPPGPVPGRCRRRPLCRLLRSTAPCASPWPTSQAVSSHPCAGQPGATIRAGTTMSATPASAGAAKQFRNLRRRNRITTPTDSRPGRWRRSGWPATAPSRSASGPAGVRHPGDPVERRRRQLGEHGRRARPPGPGHGAQHTEHQRRRDHRRDQQIGQHADHRDRSADQHDHRHRDHLRGDRDCQDVRPSRRKPAALQRLRPGRRDAGSGRRWPAPTARTRR